MLPNEEPPGGTFDNESPAARRRQGDEDFLRRLDDLLEIVDPDGTVSGSYARNP